MKMYPGAVVVSALLLAGCAAAPENPPNISAFPASVTDSIADVPVAVPVAQVPEWVLQESPGYGVGCVSYRPGANQLSLAKVARIKALAVLSEQKNRVVIDATETSRMVESASKGGAENYQREIRQHVSGYVNPVVVVRKETLLFPDGEKLCVALQLAGG